MVALIDDTYLFFFRLLHMILMVPSLPLSQGMSFPKTAMIGRLHLEKFLES